MSEFLTVIDRLNKRIQAAPYVTPNYILAASSGWLVLAISFSLGFVMTTATAQAQTASEAQMTSQPSVGWKADIVEGDRRLSRKELVPAEICYREALKVVRKDKATSTDDQIVCLERLARVLQTQDETEEALHLYQRSLKLVQKEHGKESVETVPTRMFLGDIYTQEAQYYLASTNYGDALNILSADEQNHSQEHAQRIADLRRRLGFVTAKVGNNTLTAQLYRESLDALMQQQELADNSILEKLLDDYCDLLYKSLGNRSSSTFQNELLKDDVGALARTRNVEDSFWIQATAARFSDPKMKNGSNSAAPTDAIDIEAEKAKRIIAGSQSADTQANTIVNQDPPQTSTTTGPTQSHSGLDRPPEDFASLAKINNQRIDFYKRMIAVDVKTLGPDHPSVARDLSGLAYVYLSEEKYDDANILLSRALKIYQATYSSNPMLVKRTESMLRLIGQRQSPQVTSALFKNYLASMPRIPLQAQKLEIALRLNYLGLLCYSEGKFEEAEKVYSWALAATALSCGEQSTFAGSCLIDYARVLRSTDKQPQAEQFDVTAQQIFTTALAKQAAASLP